MGYQMSAKMGIARLFGVGLIALIVGVALGYYMAPPAVSNPSISLNTASVSAGTQYTVTFSGFPANTKIYGWTVNENPPRTFEVGTTNAQGGLEVTANAPMTPGTWLLCASTKDNNYWAYAVLTVT